MRQIQSQSTPQIFRITPDVPVDVAGWWAASDLNLANGASITSWPSRAGVNNPLITDGVQPLPTYNNGSDALLNSRPHANFAITARLIATSDVMSAGSQWTMFVVGAATGAPLNFNIGGQSDAVVVLRNWFLMDSPGIFTGDLLRFRDHVETSAFISAQDDVAHILCCRYDSGTLKVDVMIDAFGTSGPTLPGAITIPSGIFHLGKNTDGFGFDALPVVGEVIVYNRKLTVAEVNAVMHYLQAKFGITIA